MKLYLHHEQDPEFTFIYSGSDTISVSQLKEAFLLAFNLKHPDHKIHSLSSFVVLNERKKKLSDAALLSSAVDDKSDLYVLIETNTSLASVSTPVASISEIRGQPAAPESSQKPAAPPPSSDQSTVHLHKLTSADLPKKFAHYQPEEKEAEEADPKTFEESEQLKALGNTAMREAKYIDAIERYTEAIDKTPQIALLYSNLAEAFLKLSRWEEAIANADRAIALDPTASKAYFRKGKFFSAKESFEKGKSLLKQTDSSDSVSTFQQWIEKCAKENGGKDEIDSPLEKNVAVTNWLSEARGAARQARVKGSYKFAISVWQQALEFLPFDKEALYEIAVLWELAGKLNTASRFALLGALHYPKEIEPYNFTSLLGGLYFSQKKYTEAIKWFAKSLSKTTDQKQNEHFKIQIAICLYRRGDQDAGISIIQNLLKADENNIKALFPYAVALQDRGHLQDSLRAFLKILVSDSNNKLYREYLTACVQKAGVDALVSEISALESPGPALAFLGTVVKDWGAVSESAELYRLALAAVPSSATYALNYIHVLEVENRYQQAFDVSKDFLRKNASLLSVGNFKCGDLLSVLGNISDIYAEALSIRKGGDSVKQTSLQKQIPIDSTLKTYSPDELDLLALFFTIVKILYVVGALQFMAPLAALIEPLRAGRELHTTTIRNEHAYYCCILQLHGWHSLPLPNAPPVYVIGDSHSLTTGWQTLEWKNSPHLVNMLLVTGLKAWHLREESKFFPKNNFWNVISKVPNGSDIIFLFGEIDCREGFVVSVEKCRYKDIDEAATVTIDIYLDVLKKLAKEKQLNIFVHPVVPVLNETRYIVKIFNRILKDRIEKNNERGLSFLDFFEKLLTDDQANLNKAYELDGTHMNPTYLPLISEAAKKYWKQ